MSVRTNFYDVLDFHTKFDLLRSSTPRKLTKRKLRERCEFLQEELDEFHLACGLKDDLHSQSLEDQADALIDLVYVAMGTAVMMGLPWQALWSDVQRANMSKVRGMTKRGHKVDVTKPDGWVGPKTGEILRNFGYNENEPEVDDKEYDK